MLNPIEGAPTSDAPRLAASMMPGPPPVAMTLSRWPSTGLRAPPRSDTIRAEATRFIVPARHPCGGRRAMPVRLADAGAAQDHNGRPDAPGTKPLVGFGELEEKAHPLHGIAEEKVRVRCGQAVGGRKLLKLVVRH